MADEIETQETADVESVETPRREDKRIKNLSEKVEMTSKERDEFKLKAEQASREAGFYKDFNGMIAKYPQAAELQDKIKEKVMGGYSVADATAAVLVNEGRFTQSPTPVEAPVGGSAVNQPAQTKKSVGEMSQAERLEALKQAERENLISLS